MTSAKYEIGLLRGDRGLSLTARMRGEWTGALSLTAWLREECTGELSLTAWLQLEMVKDCWGIPRNHVGVLAAAAPVKTEPMGNDNLAGIKFIGPEFLVLDHDCLSLQELRRHVNSLS